MRAPGAPPGERSGRRSFRSASVPWSDCTRGGYTATEAGRKAFLSPKTVEGYVSRAKIKLGLKSRRDIVRFALETGLLREGDP